MATYEFEPGTYLVNQKHRKNLELYHKLYKISYKDMINKALELYFREAEKVGISKLHK